MKISFQARTFVKALACVARALSEEPEPPHRHCALLHYDEADDSASLVGANAHWLAAWRFGDVVVAGRARAAALLIRRGDCLSLLDAIGSEPTGVLEVDFGNGCVTWAESGTSITYLTERVRAWYPAYKRVVPVAFEGGFPFIRFSAGLLASVMDAFQAGSASAEERVALTFGFARSPTAPVLVTSPQAPDLSAVLMPMLIGELTAAPAAPPS